MGLDCRLHRRIHLRPFHHPGRRDHSHYHREVPGRVALRPRLVHCRRYHQGHPQHQRRKCHYTKRTMPLLILQIVIALVVVGVILYLLTLIPMDPTIATLIRVLVIGCIVVWLIYVLMSLFGGISLPRPVFGR